jgi:hypothetical protein
MSRAFQHGSFYVDGCYSEAGKLRSFQQYKSATQPGLKKDGMAVTKKIN